MAARKPIHASALFDEGELRNFVRWRDLRTNTRYGDTADLPNAFEYCDYQNWLRCHRTDQHRHGPFDANFVPLDEESSFYDDGVRGNYENFVVANTCGHPLHPAHPANTQFDVQNSGHGGNAEVERVVLRCPICTLKVHLRFLLALYRRWGEVGGPWRCTPTGTQVPSDMYAIRNRAYHRAKTGLINTIDEFRGWAELEAEWEEGHPNHNVGTFQEFCAATAVEVYQKNLTFPASVAEEYSWSIQQKGNGDVYITPKSKKATLVFSHDTPTDTKHRPSSHYSHKSTRYYDPNSPYACLNEGGWDDTSFYTDYQYAIGQCRVLLSTQDPITSQYAYRDLNTGPYLGDNIHVARLLMLVQKWLDNFSSDAIVAWKQRLACTSDIWVVHKDNGEPGEDFDLFSAVGTLFGTDLEGWAKQVGDFDEDEYRE